MSEEMENWFNATGLQDHIQVFKQHGFDDLESVKEVSCIFIYLGRWGGVGCAVHLISVPQTV